MMMSDTHEILNSLLADWHRWCRGYRHTAGYPASPMFRESRSGRQWDTVGEIIDSDLASSTMETMHHTIMSMSGPHRTSLQIQARNLVTGRSVWRSERLPDDDAERMALLVEARGLLVVKLRDAGVL